MFDRIFSRQASADSSRASSREDAQTSSRPVNSITAADGCGSSQLAEASAEPSSTGLSASTYPE